MNDLQIQHCLPCEGGVKPMSQEEINKLLSQISSWKLNEKANEICRWFNFKNFYQTMCFVNTIAWIAHRENHHPDMEVGYNYCLVKYSTHAIGGLSVNDFICAAKIDAIEKG